MKIELTPEIERFAPIFEFIFGPEWKSGLFGDIDLYEFMSAPQSHLLKIKNNSEKYASSFIENNDDKSIDNILPLSFFMVKNKVFESLDRYELDKKTIEDNNKSSLLYHILVKFKNKIGNVILFEEFKDFIDIDFNTVKLNHLGFIGASPDIAFILSRTEQGKEIEFETQFEVTKKMIQRLAEGPYKKIMSSLLKLTRIYLQDEKNDRKELGNILSTCKIIWEKHADLSVFTGLVDDNIRLIRNAIVHGDISINETNVEFEFEESKKIVKAVISKDDITNLYVSFIKDCISMITAIRLFYYEIEVKMEDEEKKKKINIIEYLIKDSASKTLAMISSNEYKNLEQELLDGASQIILLEKDTDELQKINLYMKFMSVTMPSFFKFLIPLSKSYSVCGQLLSEVIKSKTDTEINEEKSQP